MILEKGRSVKGKNDFVDFFCGEIEGAAPEDRAAPGS
jgi:hypothetical protein